MAVSSVETEWARAPPVSGPAWRRILLALYNPDEKSFLGRTPKRWGIVLTFYLVFYAVLALLFAACMGGLFLTIDEKKPTHTLEKSLIGNNPGVAFRPRIESGILLKLDSDNSSSFQHYVDQLEDFLQPYQSSKAYSFEDCSGKDSFGYPETPCLLIKLNKIFGWQPDCYKEPSSLPSEMPEDLKEHISQLDVRSLNQIWLSCEEEKNNQTKIEYPWGRGLTADHYPYTNGDGYLSPLLAIKVTPPENVLVTIRCRFWAKNILYNKSIKEPSGYTRLQLIVEKSSLNSTEAEN